MQTGEHGCKNFTDSFSMDSWVYRNNYHEKNTTNTMDRIRDICAGCTYYHFDGFNSSLIFFIKTQKNEDEKNLNTILILKGIETSGNSIEFNERQVRQYDIYQRRSY